MIIPPSTVLNYIADRAGQRPSPVKKVIITIHIQEGTNSLPDYFRNIPADATLWCDRGGVMHAMMKETDTVWTNGDAYEPLEHSPYLDAVLWSKGVTNTNPYALTIETAGYASVQDAIDNGGLSPAQAQIYGHITDAQYQSLVQQCAVWCDHYGIPVAGIVRHSSVGQHKFCPGEAINVEQLRLDVQKVLDARNPVTYNPNPKGLSVGAGIIGEMTKRNDVAVTNEQYFQPAPNQPGLLQHSMCWGRDYFYMGFYHEDKTWTVQVFKHQ